QPDVGGRSGARRHPKPETLGHVRHPGACRARQGLWRRRAGHRKGALYACDPHPDEHISRQAIGYSLDWFAKTLQGGTPRPSDDQIWFRKEIGTLIALIGFVVLLMGVFDGLLEASVFSRLRLPEAADGTMPAHEAAKGGRWTTAFLLSAFIPALTYYPAFALAGTFVTPSAYLPQGITNPIVVWARINAVIAMALMAFAPKRASRKGIIGPSILIALATIIVGYIALWLAGPPFQIAFPVLV